MSVTIETGDYITAKEAAEIAGIHRKTFSAYLARGQAGIPEPVLIAGQRFYRRAEIEAWAASRGER